MTIEQLKVMIRSGPGRLRTASVVSVVGLGLVVGTVYAGSPVAAGASPAVSDWWTASSGTGAADVARAEPGGPTAAEELHELARRVERVNRGWSELTSFYDAEVAPIERVLLRYRSDSTLVRRIAVALVREAERVELEPRLLLAVLLVENPWLEPKIRSPVGAIGLMQVMPVHRGGWSQCDPDLEDVEANICHGAHIFAHYFERSNGDLDRALLRYNGCVNGTNTPDCRQYPNHVFANAGRASVMSWLSGGPAAGSP